MQLFLVTAGVGVAERESDIYTDCGMGHGRCTYETLVLTVCIVLLI